MEQEQGQAERIYSFPPVIDERARVLVLGTAPSVKSLEHRQFYGHPRNYFWGMVYGLFDAGAPDEDYGKRLAFLQDHHLAVFDVIESCERPGSLDVNIKNERPNDLPALLKQYPGLKGFAFNGSKAYDTFRKYFRDHPAFRDITLLKMPSTSPIPTQKMRNLEDRIEVWKALLPYLELPE
ncbi:DNA-deoxyinosine glycosylase [Paenibacillus glycanilyticus]|uniref:DNA-deoxyinosine glycosylase n=1 Tax=Paenibacillus glycanilyticus TaxID=126569 RepID=A0ABQ6GP25_9BACL|nr:DNA-deoxyinosine glycosylase [Paenibacillus glycanilyticus]GLX71342.1 DNA-deoxyinosine glycosylase [Paenibacillus glycanilyticus]